MEKALESLETCGSLASLVGVASGSVASFSDQGKAVASASSGRPWPGVWELAAAARDVDGLRCGSCGQLSSNLSDGWMSRVGLSAGGSLTAGSWRVLLDMACNLPPLAPEAPDKQERPATSTRVWHFPYFTLPTHSQCSLSHTQMPTTLTGLRKHYKWCNAARLSVNK